MKGTMTPSPPRRAGSERSSFLVGPNANWPVRISKKTKAWGLIKRTVQVMRHRYCMSNIQPMVQKHMCEGRISCLWLSDSNIWQFFSLPHPRRPLVSHITNQNSSVSKAEPGWCLPSSVMTTPIPWNNALALQRCWDFTIKQVLVVFQTWVQSESNNPTKSEDPEGNRPLKQYSTYHVCETSQSASRWINGMMPKAYIDIAKISPWVVPSWERM